MDGFLSALQKSLRFHLYSYSALHCPQYCITSHRGPDARPRRKLTLPQAVTEYSSLMLHCPDEGRYPLTAHTDPPAQMAYRYSSHPASTTG